MALLGQTVAMDMNQSAIDLLAVALRTRVDRRDDLIGFTGFDPATVDAALASLEAAGFLSQTAGIITYRRPDVATADFTRGIVAELGVGITGTLERTRATLAALPGLLEAWQMGDSDENRLPIDVLHGPWAPADMWQLQYARGIPVTTIACMPDTSMMAAVKVEHMASFWQGRAGHPLDVRLIMSVADATAPALQDRIAGELAAGVRIRMHPTPPSWFWVTDHDTVGLPLRWGEAWPSSVMAIQSPAVAAVLEWVYERVWDEAVPVADTDHSWEPLLELMDRGMTMESASLALGLAPRTGRRRVAQAMDHFGTRSLFALGAAWGVRRGSGSTE